MSQFVGMDIEGVRNLARVLGQRAEEINTLTNTLTHQLSGTQWVGNDANQFRNDWTSHHVSALRQVSQALVDAQHACMTNAQQQEAASGH